jgi:hypothetical protein
MLEAASLVRMVLRAATLRFSQEKMFVKRAGATAIPKDI